VTDIVIRPEEHDAPLTNAIVTYAPAFQERRSLGAEDCTQAHVKGSVRWIHRHAGSFWGRDGKWWTTGPSALINPFGHQVASTIRGRCASRQSSRRGQDRERI
jgi:hypothetical protein